MGRKSKNKKLRRTIGIIAEGTNTEAIYFKAISEQIEQSIEEKYSFTVVFVDTDKTDARGLVREAITIKSGYDEIWAVFDKNGYTKHAEAFQEAVINQVNIAFSSIAFEHWVLLHFERNKTAFVKSENVIDHLKQQNYLEYGKRANIAIHIYPKLQPRTEFAIENAAWLRREMQSQLAQSGGKIYELNPYTDIDKLLSQILGMANEVIWGDIGETIEIGQVKITFQKVQLLPNNTLEISVSIENHGDLTYAVSNYNQRCYLADDSVCYLPWQFAKTILIEPATRKEVSISFQEVESSGTLPFIRLDFVQERKKVIIR
jgi:hypothetical protein